MYDFSGIIDVYLARPWLYGVYQLLAAVLLPLAIGFWKWPYYFILTWSLLRMGSWGILVTMNGICYCFPVHLSLEDDAVPDISVHFGGGQWFPYWGSAMHL